MKPALAAAAVVLASGLWTPAVASAAPATVPAVPTCADLSGVLDAGQICRIQATDPAYSLTVSYPVDYPDQAAVVDYVQQTRDGFLNVANAPGPHEMPYELDTTATRYGSRATQGVVLKTFQDVGGAHPQTYYESFTWDQALRRPVTVDDLFRPGTDPFPVILPIVTSELEKQSGQPVEISPGVGLDPQKYQNFAVTDDALIFFFGQGELLPEAAGAVEVSVPRSAVAAMLA
jgi:hypothetical protein